MPDCGAVRERGAPCSRRRRMPSAWASPNTLGEPAIAARAHVARSGMANAAYEEQTHDPRVWNATRGATDAAHGCGSPPPLFRSRLRWRAEPSSSTTTDPCASSCARRCAADGWEVEEADDGALVEERLETTRYDLLHARPLHAGHERLRGAAPHPPAARRRAAGVEDAADGAHRRALRRRRRDGLEFAERLGADACLPSPSTSPTSSRRRAAATAAKTRKKLSHGETE